MMRWLKSTRSVLRGLREYAACQSRAFMKGIGTFVLGSAAVFFLQRALHRRLPCSLQWSLLLSLGAGSVCSYAVTRSETQKCSDLWIYLETGEQPSGRTGGEEISQAAPPAETGTKTTRYGDDME
ncbi:transmembrane protein 141 isoform X2 [Lepisosteus oculatus]|uniref:transmembrane protein 141 isoform X2 n=1 Tax=Lepisosteus oculatus TaxID=7918 RepID=UPI00073FE915|nr:PREDICTED: transmembrane protein 141 isoform X2 [Lepisosteus oculatus]